MTIQYLAEFYVNFIEPALKAAVFIVIVVVLLYIINLIRDSKKKTDLVNSLFSLIVKLITGAVVWVGGVAVWLVKMLLKTITVIFAAVRDFFSSKI